MISEEKIKLMSDLTRYEEKEGRQNSVTNSYFKIDYISRHMLGSFFSYTFCFLILIIMVLIYHLNSILNDVDILNAIDIFKPYIKYYVAGLVIYELITAIVSNARYNHAKRSLRMENAKLRRLEKRYDIEDRSRLFGGE